MTTFGGFFVRAGSRRRSPTAWPMPGELTSPTWDEPGRSIGFRALDDVAASDEIAAWSVGGGWRGLSICGERLLG
jgi:hypothetical protein